MSEQEDITRRKPELSAAQRTLLEKWKRGEFSRDAQTQIIPRRTLATPVPMSFTQQRLWFLDQLVPESAAYHVSTTLRLNGKLDLSALERSLNEIVRRHEALRTTFASEAGQPVQIIAPTMRVPLAIEHLEELPLDERESEARRLATEEVHRPFDLARGPLLRMKLLRLGPEEHILIFVMHHIVSDSWSLGIFLRELATLYTAFHAGKPSPLPDLPLQYADYSVWQRQRLQGAQLEQQLTYWKQQLDGCPTLLALPTDHPRPPVQAFRGTAQTFTLPRALTDNLKTLARAHGTTLFQVLLTAFQILLSRYSGQHDIIVGSPIAGRTHADLEPLIGFFANTLALRTDLSGNPSFREVLTRVQKVTLDAYAHQDMPFEQIVEALQPERVMSHNPLFQVMLVLQSAPLEKPELIGLTLNPFEVESHTAILDLWLSLQEKLNGDGLNGILEYNTDLFEAATISRLIGHYQTLLAAVVTDVACPISSLPLLTEAEEQQILLHWNATEKAYNLEPCLHQRVEAQVKRYPDAIAVVFEDHYLSYQALNQSSNQLARRLQSLSVGAETLVGICMERSLELVIGLLAILKAGGAYLPLDPSYPAERLAFMLQDAQVALVLTQTMLTSQLQAYEVNLLDVARELQTSRSANSPDPVSGAGPANLAYVIYTSGSTGRPKGAMLTHRGVCNRLLWMQETYCLTPEDRVLQKTPFSFDVSVWEFFWPLLTGANLVIARPEGHRDSAYLVEIIQEQQITTLHFVPSMLAIFLEERDLAGCTSLQRVICSGEALTSEFQERFFARLSASLYNLYGPTEASIDVTAWTCDPQHPHHSVPIGRPIANTRIYLLDQQLRPVPIGIVGELYIGGIGLARGYLNRAALTAERFISDPFAGTSVGTRFIALDGLDASGGSEPGSRLYKTGDLARYLPDGNIEFLGRSDSQVKLHGFRIELEEIEAHLRRYPLLKDAVAQVREDTPGEKRLVAYVVPHADAHLQSESLPDLLSTDDQVAHWQQVFDGLYREPSATEQADFNIVGWNSSYTNLPLPPAEMHEWVEQTVERIARLRPQRVLEIGCGAGLLLFRLAPQCAFYCGTDFAREGLDYIRQHLPLALQQEGRVQLLQLAANDLGDIEEYSFDTIILNSVIQYFPDAAYLLQVLTEAVQKLKPGGRLFIGDVRNLSLLEAFHTSVELHNAPASLPIAQLRQRVHRRTEQESELVVDPAFFATLPQQFSCITAVEIQLKRGCYHNELTRFRYDVILHVGSSDEETLDGGAVSCWLDWQEQALTLESIEQILLQEQPEMLGIARVPNTRLSVEKQALELLESRPDNIQTIDQLRDCLKEIPSTGRGIDPEEFWSLAKALPYRIAIGWSGSEQYGDYQVIFRRQGAQNIIASSTIKTPSASLTDWSSYFETCRAPTTLSRPVAPRSIVEALRSAESKYTNNPLRNRFLSQLGSALRNYLKQQLPEYMLPTVFTVLEALPLSPNGKVERRALPPPELPAPELEGNFVPPSTPVEEKLAHIWAEVLGLECVGIRHNFFELGGDSIRSIQVVSRALAAGVKLTPRDMFQHQTIAELATVATLVTPIEPERQTETPSDPLAVQAEAQQRARYIDELVRVEALQSMLPHWHDLDVQERRELLEQEIEDIYPLTPFQEYMLRQRLSAPKPGLYVVHQFSFLREEQVNPAAIKQAWQEVINRNPIQRTSFAWEGLSRQLQVVHRHIAVPLEEYDWRDLSPEVQKERGLRYVQEARQRNFQLDKAPHTRFALIRLSENTYQFFWGFNYMLQDGWSYPLILKEFFTLYEAYKRNEKVTLERRPLYRHFITWHQQQDIVEAENYWRRTLQGFRVPTPLVSRVPGNIPGGPEEYTYEDLYLPGALTAALRSMTRQHQLTLNTLLQGAWALLLSGYTGELDVLFGGIVSGRPANLPGVESIIGLFNNLLPLRIQVIPEATLLSWLRDIQAQQAEMRQYDYSPPLKIKEWSDVPDNTPLFESYLVVENFPSDITVEEKLRNWIRDGSGLTQTEHPLRIEVWPLRTILLSMGYYLHYFDPDTIKRILRDFQSMLEAFVTHPQQRLAQLLQFIASRRISDVN